MKKKPEIIVLSGIPNSGKSTWVRTQQEVDLYEVVSRDTIREIYFPAPYIYSKQNEEEVTRIFNSYLNRYVRWGRNIILDNTFCKESYINSFIKSKPERYTLRVVFFDCPLWKAYIRNVLRWIKTGKFIPFKVIQQMKINYDKIDKKKYNDIF